MNSHKYDDLSFKLLSATVIAGVIAAFVQPATPSAAPATSTPVTQPAIQALAEEKITLAVASEPPPSTLLPPVYVSAGVKHSGHRRGLAKS